MTKTTTTDDWGFYWDKHDIAVPTKHPIPPPPSRTTAAFSTRAGKVRPEPGAGVPVADYDPLAYGTRDDIRDCFRVNRYGR